jgi:D-serine deaminase-like pyridoxal phosphate-dependent protein
MKARTTIDWRAKGFPPSAQGLSTDDFVESWPSLFEAGFSWPVMVIRRSAVDHNVAMLADYCADREVWGQVLSRPEPRLALVGVGKRDISFDEGMPVVLAARSRAGAIHALGAALSTISMTSTPISRCPTAAISQWET